MPLTEEKSMFNGVAVITGGSSGIGLALAERLLQHGGRVAICGRSAERLQTASHTLEPFADRLLAVQADVTNREQVRDLVTRTVERFGRVDVLINSAGSGYLGPITETSDATIQSLLDTNIRGALIACQEVWPHMAAQKFGHIVNLCGILGIKTLATAALYCATKHALVGMGGALALEGRRLGIRVTNVCCSGVDTPFWEGIPGKPRSEVLLTPDEVAWAVADLLALPAHVIPNQLMLQHIAHQM
jgi:NAD(P)-dependent dehydrogenase (short-subunit alcohol dehydrogenase family)